MNTIIKYPNHYIVNAQRHIHVLIIYHLNAASYKPFLQPFHNNFACSNHYLLSKKTYCKFLSKKPRHFFFNNCKSSRLTHHRLSLPPSMHLGVHSHRLCYPPSIHLTWCYKPFLQPFHNTLSCSKAYLLSKKTYCNLLSKNARHFFLNNCNRSRLTHHRLSLPPSMHLDVHSHRLCYPPSIHLG